MKKNTEDSGLIYLRKMISANLYWHSKSAFANDAVREIAVDRIIKAIDKRYVLKERDHKE
jgi:hypothetical protein